VSLPLARRTGALAVGLVVGSLALAACGSSSSSTPSSSSPAGTTSASTSVDPALAAKIPAAITSAGKITFGTDASYAPSEFIDTDGSTIVGFDVDLGKAIAAKLGLAADFQNAGFDTIIVGVDKGKYDLGMSSFTVNNDRMAKANMVSYFSAGTSWAVAKGNPGGITPDNACGKTIAVQKATVQVDDITARAKTCTGAGKADITIQQYALQSDATTAVASGKADAMLADSPVVSYAIQQTGDKLEQAGDIYGSAPYGIVVAKSATDFAGAVQGAVQSLIDDGTYLTILTKWGVQGGAVTKAELNPTVS
jgi:polar amino acid transport system substrate-binding protein